MKKLDMKTTEVTQENIDKLAALFPHCITEVKESDGTITRAVDFNLLKQEFSDKVVDGPRESYSINWPGKKEALVSANTPINKTLRPCREESVDFDTTANLYIEGDNLEALKLLQESYLGKVKMIYIDPPYNTGKDFVYKDNYTRSREEELEESGQRDSVGGRLITNPETNGRYHSNWLSMMYPRLKLARNLLKDDGIIYISIDDNEVANLRKLCDEVFGEDNFASIFTIKSNPRGSQSTIYSANVHESLLCYVKNTEFQNGFSIPLDESMVTEYKLEDESGKYRLLGIRLRGGAWRREERPLLYYPIYINPINGQISLNQDESFTYEVLPIKPTTQEDGTWRWGKEKFINDLHLIIAKKVTRNDEVVWDIFQKDYLHLGDGQEKNTKAKTIWDEKEVNYQNGTNEVKKLFDKNVFNFPKPTYMLKKCATMINDKSSIILDFFSGSATTAHSILQLNVEDNGNRKFIMIQLPEETNEKSEAYKAGYKTIPEIGKERIRRAGQKIKEDNADKEGIDNLDIGFRVLKIDSSNMKDVYYTPDTMNQSILDSQEQNIKDDRNAEDLLFQVLLDWGVDLTLPIQKETISGKEVYFVDDDTLAACFDDDLNEEFVRELAKRKVMRVVFKESGFTSDEIKINIEQIFTQLSPDTEVRGI